MNKSLAQQAIECAMNGDWLYAVKVNKEILKENQEDLDALNRLARAYAELGEMTKAKTIAAKVLKIDPYNSIATKAMARWKTVKKGEVGKNVSVSPSTFLEEPGKTRIVSLINLGCPDVISKLDSGDKVQLDCHCHRVAVATMDGKYIGKLPDDLSRKIKVFSSKGNEYETIITSIDPTEAKVFIREIKKGPGMENTLSFPIEKLEYSATTRADLGGSRAQYDSDSGLD